MMLFKAVRQCLVLVTLLAVPIFSGIPSSYASYNIEATKNVDPVLERQRDILRLFMNVHQPTIYEDQIALGDTVDVNTLGLYANTLAGKEFIRYYELGFLGPQEIFSITIDDHRHQAIILFSTLYYMRSYDSFYRVACWARSHVNPGLYVYSLTEAIIRRPDCHDIVIPPPYEVDPYYFIDADIIVQAREQKIQKLYETNVVVKDTVVSRNYIDPVHHSDYYNAPIVMDDYYAGANSDLVDRTRFAGKISPYYSAVNKVDQITAIEPVHEVAIADSVDEIVIAANRTHPSLWVDSNQRLAYYFEDVGLNSYYYYFHLEHPYWIGTGQFGYVCERRGELFYHIHKQLLARYYLERLSHGMGHVEIVDLGKPVTSSFMCPLNYANGLDYPDRARGVEIISNDHTLMKSNRLERLDYRIMDAIDLGYVETESGERLPLYQGQGINILGNLIEGNKDSVNVPYYGAILNEIKSVFGFGEKSYRGYIPSALDHYATTLRDPIFYNIAKKVMFYFDSYKRNLPSYTISELIFPGVKVESIEVDQLITYFEPFDVELNNVVTVDKVYESDKICVNVKCRKNRLNHKPFTTRLNVFSDKSTKGVVRLFIGPKYDENDNIICINDNRHEFVEFDRFVVDLRPGKNIIDRSSLDSLHTTVDRTSTYTMYKSVMLSIQGTEEFTYASDISKSILFPNRLILPKGNRNGALYQIYTIITPYVSVTTTSSATYAEVGGHLKEERYVSNTVTVNENPFLDHLPLGYPFDRVIDRNQFFVPNMCVNDIVIYHRDNHYVC